MMQSFFACTACGDAQPRMPHDERHPDVIEMRHVIAQQNNNNRRRGGPLWLLGNCPPAGPDCAVFVTWEKRRRSRPIRRSGGRWAHCPNQNCLTVTVFVTQPGLAVS